MIEPAFLVAAASLTGTVVFGILTAVHNGGGDIRQQIEEAKLEAARGRYSRRLKQSTAHRRAVCKIGTP